MTKPSAWQKFNGALPPDSPGVYLLARFTSHPPRVASHLQREVIYIGQTLRTMSIRLREFDRSAFKKLNGHSGGWNFSEIFMHSKKGLCPKWLHVSFMELGNSTDEETTYVKYLERKMIWEYARKWKQTPQCNKK